MLNSNSCCHFTVCKQMSSDSFKDIAYNLCVYKQYTFNIYKYIQGLALNNQQESHEPQPSLRVRVDLGIMEMNRYSRFPKALELEPRHEKANVVSRTLVCGEILSLCKDAIGVFYSPSHWDECSLRIISIHWPLA